jgi:hypothetical protein
MPRMKILNSIEQEAFERAFQTGGWEEPRLIRLDRLAPSWKAILSPKLIVSTSGFGGSTRCSGGAFW